MADGLIECLLCRAVDPDPHGSALIFSPVFGSAFIFPPGFRSALIFPPGFGSAFNMRIREGNILRKKTEKCKKIGTGTGSNCHFFLNYVNLDQLHVF